MWRSRVRRVYSEGGRVRLYLALRPTLALLEELTNHVACVATVGFRLEVEHEAVGQDGWGYSPHIIIRR